MSRLLLPSCEGNYCRKQNGELNPTAARSIRRSRSPIGCRSWSDWSGSVRLKQTMTETFSTLPSRLSLKAAPLG